MITIPETDRTSDYAARVTALWERNLGTRLAPHADYFLSGGDSLRATQLLGWIQQGFGVELSLLDFFEARTIEAQSRLLLARTAALANGAPPQPEYRFFGRVSERLFGVLHRAHQANATSGAVLCYPMGQEYMRIHRTYVELARRLAAANCHVLRFDYYGAGDSAGETIDGSLQRWKADIHTAIDEMRRLTAVRDVHLVGSRIGANLAVQVHGERTDLAGLVLWEPILNGAEYIAALRRASGSMLADNARLEGYAQRPMSWFAEFAGFPVSKTLFDELAAIDLVAAPAASMHDILVLANSAKPALASFVASRTNALGGPQYVVTEESDAIWLKEDRENKGVIPVRALQAIASFVSRPRGERHE